MVETVIETFDGRIMAEHNGEMFDLRSIEYEPKGYVYVKKGRRSIPNGPNHPWKKFIINPKKIK